MRTDREVAPRATKPFACMVPLLYALCLTGGCSAANEHKQERVVEPVVGAELLRLKAAEVADLIAKHPIPLIFVVRVEEAGAGLTLEIIDATDAVTSGPGFKTELPPPVLSIAINQDEVAAQLGSPQVGPRNTLAKAVVRGFFYWYSGADDEERAVRFPSEHYVRFSSMVEGHWDATVWHVPRQPGGFFGVNMNEDGTVLSVNPGE